MVLWCFCASPPPLESTSKRKRPHENTHARTREVYLSVSSAGGDNLTKPNLLHLLALIGDSVEGLATGVGDDKSAVILCVPSPQLVEVAAIPSGEARVRFHPARRFFSKSKTSREHRSLDGLAPPPPPPTPPPLQKGVTNTRERRGHVTCGVPWGLV